MKQSVTTHECSNVLLLWLWQITEKADIAAGLCPDPLGELKRSPHPIAEIMGVLLLRGGEGSGREGKGRYGGEGEGRKGKKEGRERGGR